MKKRNCPYCNVTSFRFKKEDIKFVCVKCKGIVYNRDNPKVEELSEVEECNHSFIDENNDNLEVCRFCNVRNENS